MKTLPHHIKEIFYKTLKEDISVDDFEQWLYTDTDLESLLTPEDYYDLISLDYKRKGAKYQIWNLLQKQIDVGDFETYKMLELLQKVQKKDEDLPYILMDFYHLYCDGYRFLQRLGFDYGLFILAPRAPYLENATADTWEELTTKEQKELLKNLMPEVQEEVKQVTNWIVTKEIVLTGYKNERGKYEFKDFREKLKIIDSSERNDLIE